MYCKCNLQYVNIKTNLKQIVIYVSMDLILSDSERHNRDNRARGDTPFESRLHLII